MSIALLIVVCALGVALLLAADLTGRAWLEWIGKPLAAVAFIAAGWYWGAWDTVYGRWILLGLVLGAAGDVLLIPKGRGRVFLGGMVAFLLGHLAYVIAFLQLPLNAVAGGAAAVVLLIGTWPLLRWLLPHVPGDFRAPVLAYLVVIAAMVVAAVAATGAGAHIVIAAGAIGFAVSDLAVARNRFVRPGFINRAWGIPLYFASQMLIAQSVGLVG